MKIKQAATLKLTLTQTLTITGGNFPRSWLSWCHYIIAYWNIFLLEMFWTTLPFKALSLYTSNLMAFVLLTVNMSSVSQLFLFVCELILSLFIQEVQCNFFLSSLTIFSWSSNSTGSSAFVVLGSSGGHSWKF